MIDREKRCGEQMWFDHIGTANLMGRRSVERRSEGDVRKSLTSQEINEPLETPRRTERLVNALVLKGSQISDSLEVPRYSS